MYVTLISVMILLVIFLIFFWIVQRHTIKALSLNCVHHNRTSEKWRIPKVIYRTFYSKEAAKKYQKAWDFTAKYNPEFKQVLFDDKDCEAFLKEYYPTPVYEAYHKINPKYGAARADLFRYALMYEKGGIYLDVKSAAKSLYKLVSPRDGYILIPWGHFTEKRATGNAVGEFQQWHIICRPKHPFLKAVLDQVVYNINHDKGQKGKRGVLHMTGPICYTKTIKEHLYNNDYKTTLPNGNGILVYSLESHEKIMGKKHYSRVKEPIIIPEKISK